MVTTTRPKVKSRPRHDAVDLQPLSINFLHFTLAEIMPGQDIAVKVTTAWSKVKSRSHCDVAHLQPSINVHTKYQLPPPYSFQDITRKRFYRSRSLQQGQRSNQGHTTMLHTYNSQPMSLRRINFLHLTFLTFFRDIAWIRFYRSKIKSRSNHNAAYLQSPINVTTKYQLPTSYGFRDMAQTRFYRSRSLQKG